MQFFLPRVKKCLEQGLIGLLAALILSEVVLRLLGFQHINNNTLDAHNLVIFKPNNSFVAKEQCFTARVTTNSWGFHSKEYTIAKSSNTFRIVVLGDSFVEAAQVPLEQTFFAELEAKLNQTALGGKHYEVIPVAKSGHGTLANLLFAREYALRLQPDVLIDSFITNDLTDDLADQQNLHAQPAGAGYDAASLRVDTLPDASRRLLWLKHVVLEHSILLERLWKNVLVVKAQLAQASVTNSNNEEGVAFPSVLGEALLYPDSENATRLWRSETRALSSFAAFAKAHHTKFLLLHLTEQFLIDSQARIGWSVDTTKTAPFDSGGVARRLGQIAAEQGFGFFSTQPYFTEQWARTHESPVWSCNNHYNARGQAWVAEALYGFLQGQAGEWLRK